MRRLLNKYLLGIALLFACLLCFSEPNNVGLLKQTIRAYHDSGAYDKEVNQVIMQAKAYLTAEVQKYQNEKNPPKLALVLDIDETSLSNYKKLESIDFMYDKVWWHKENLAANCPVIDPMLSLYNAALTQHINVFFVSGRKESERQATEDNLIKAGYRNWAGLYLKPNNYEYPSNIPFKSGARAEISQKGYLILANIGDQDSDLKGGNAERVFKLPNPFYFIP